MDQTSRFCLLLAILLPGCGPGPVHLAVPEGSSARAISFLGDTLWSAPVNPGDGPRLVTQVQLARAKASLDTTDLTAQITLARRTAAMGQLREAVDRLSRVSRMHYLSPRVYRHRGELLLGLRELEQAYADFETAEDLIATHGRPRGVSQARARVAGDSTEWAIMVESVDQPDSAGPALTSVQYQVAFHMGVIRYLQGDAVAARALLITAAQRATSDEDLVEAALWLFFAIRRTGRMDEASEILASVDSAWQVQRHRPEHQLLLAYAGRVSADSIQARALDRHGGKERALYAYGIGFMLLTTGRTDEAELWFQQARAIPEWTALPFLAAEADLARLRGTAPREE